MLIDFEAWLANLVDKALSSSPFPLDSLISAADKNHSQTCHNCIFYKKVDVNRKKSKGLLTSISCPNKHHSYN